MEYITKKCPNCGKVVDRHSHSKLALGNPRKKCMYCGIEYFDSEIKEWETMTNHEKLKFINNGNSKIILPLWGDIFCFIFGIILLILGISSIARGDSTGFIVGFIFFLLFSVPSGMDIYKLYNAKQILSQPIKNVEIILSVLRTKDEEYRNELIEAGYKFYPTNTTIDPDTLQQVENRIKLKDMYIAIKKEFKGNKEKMIHKINSMYDEGKITIEEHKTLCSLTHNNMFLFFKSINCLLYVKI